MVRVGQSWADAASATKAAARHARKAALSEGGRMRLRAVIVISLESIANLVERKACEP
jgi:hypothetical protein